MKRAYSLVRFSSWRQAKGQSQRRQLEWSAQYAEKHDCLLDDSLRQDRPVSAFRGANRSKGALADFLDMVKVGRVPKGSLLLIESLDRLSREEVDEALTLFLGILKSGVDIVTMAPERHYSKSSVGDIVGLLEPLIIMSRAHEESAIKSKRIADVWKQRRLAAGPDRPMNGIGPAWLRMEGGRWRLIEERADIVRQIFRLAIDGHGTHSIAHELCKEKVPPMGRGGQWHYSYIAMILRNRAVLGEYQPMVKQGKRKPIGDPIAGYYPAVVSEAEFYQAQTALDSRKNARGPRGEHVRNLFTGLLRDARDGCTLVTNSESSKSKRVKLVSSGGLRGKGGSSYRTFPYDLVEDAFLRFVKELKASDVLPREGGNAEDTIATLAGRLQTIEHRIIRVMADLKESGEFDTGMRLLRDLEADKASVAAALEKTKAEQATSEAEVLGESQSLIDLLDSVKGEERLALRLKLKQRIRALVSEMWALVVPLGRNRLCALQVYFCEGDRRRDYLILHRPANRFQPGESWVRSFADAAAPDDFDLRRRADAKKLERLLSSLDLDRIG